jgi:(p)ppGpp synthase/HD superfamily hydrolase
VNSIIKAAAIAARLHKDQKRDNSGKPYVTHLIRVAGRVATLKGVTENDVAGAYLHDVLEDQCDTPEKRDAVIQEIIRECGMPVMEIVVALTNPSKGSQLPRHERKQMDRNHLADCSRNIKIIKLVDRIDNLNEMLEDLLIGRETRYRFLITYCNESQALVNEALYGVDMDLEMELNEAIKLLRAATEARLNAEKHSFAV